MSRTPPHPPRRRLLSKEDEALWEHTAASLKPLRGKKARHLAEQPDTEAPPVAAAKSKAAVKKPDAAAPPAAKPAPRTEKVAPPLNVLDRKAARKLRQGQLAIEARIDLHGMRQHEAHAALRRFLLAAFAKGRRWVLVITGKGGPRARDDEATVFGAPERGVLRKNVPMWLAEPELRAVVVSYAPAAIAHGGDGALYVQLRNPERTRS